MGIVLRIILALLVLGFLALVAFSYYPGSLEPERGQVAHPVTLGID